MKKVKALRVSLPEGRAIVELTVSELMKFCKTYGLFIFEDPENFFAFNNEVGVVFVAAKKPKSKKTMDTSSPMGSFTSIGGTSLTGLPPGTAVMNSEGKEKPPSMSVI